MKIAILSRNKRLYSTNALYEAGIKRGHDMRVIDYVRCHMEITSMRPAIYLGSEKLEGYDAIIPRIGATYTHFGCAVVRQFEMMGVTSVNESVAISRSRDKLRSLQLLARKGIGLPVTGFAHDPRTTEALIDQVGGAPLVIKLLEGTQGGRRRPRGHPQSGRVRHRSLPRTQCKHSRSGVHQGGRRGRYPLPRYW